MKRFVILLVLFFVLSALPAAAETPPKDMVLIKTGCFTMGTDQVFYYEYDRENLRERPAHKVCLDSFYLDKYEISQKSWEESMGFNNSTFKGPNLPVSHIKWEEIKAFCKKRGKRLPTEAEWEYAARAGSETLNPWGDGIDGDYLWFAGNSLRKFPEIGTKKPNAWGVHDMMGSVWEWVEDWFSVKYYQESPENNPKGPTTRHSWRVIRGPSWVDDEDMVRVVIRDRGLADATETYWVGGRCAKSIKGK